MVGYVSHPTAEELKQAAVAGLDESDWIGRAGLEARAQATLGGAKGGVIHIVDQAGRVLRTVAQKPAVAGQDLILELNSTVQRQAFEALAGQTGSVVVLDPRDNALRALVSVPSFDPNRFVVGLSDAEWQELNAPTSPARPARVRSCLSDGFDIQAHHHGGWPGAGRLLAVADVRLRPRLERAARADAAQLGGAGDA